MIQKQDFIETEIGRIPEDWAVKKICEIDASKEAVQTGPFGSTLHAHDYAEEGVPLLLVKNIAEGRVTDKDMPKVNFKKAQELKKFWLKEGDIVFTRVGAVGRTLYITKDYEGWMFSGQTLRLRIKSDQVNNQFIEYFFRSPKFQNISEATALGTTRPSINTSILANTYIPIPPLIEQKKIVENLSSLDDKIALNRSMNSTLEAIGQALFARWFVDFVFPDEEGKPYRSSGGEMVETELGEVPEGWGVATIGDLDNSIKYGYTQSASSEQIGPKFLRITDIQGGKIEWSTVPYCKISENDIEKYLLLSGDIVVARTGASTGENVYIEDCPKAVFASYLVRIRFKNKNLARYVAKFMRSQAYRDYIDGCIGGSAQPNASAKTLTAVNLVVPPDGELIKFGKTVESLELIKFKNNNESTILTQIRDALLPKLMFGEIRVGVNRF